MLIQSNEELIKFIFEKGKAKYVFFWGHQKPKSGASKTCFSQWYESPFEEDGLKFMTAEHYMMYHKAMLFANEDISRKVLKCKHPREAKKLGRQVVGFDETIWNNKRYGIVVNANVLKFGQNPDLLGYLLNTNERVLVEASPVDKIWGIGLAVDNPNVEQPEHWQGLNLLGYALMAAREQLSKNK